MRGRKYEFNIGKWMEENGINILHVDGKVIAKIDYGTYREFPNEDVYYEFMERTKKAKKEKVSA